jgi:uncharacterized repeat protein (TIGR01451 family)
MRKFLIALCLGLLVVVGVANRSVGAPAGMISLSGHVPAVVKTLAATGRVAATNTLHLAIGLPLRNRELLTNLLQQINDPASQNYHHFLTPSQFTDQFGPTPKDYQAVVDFAAAHHLTVTRTHGNRMLVEVDGKASAINQAFAITLHTYRDSKENRQFFSPDAEPSVPTGLPVLDISGLNNYARPRSFITVKPSIPNGASASSLAGSAPDGSGNYFGNDFHKAYLPGTTLTGAGQKIALVQFDGYFPNDIAAYAQAAGLPALSITNILLDGFNGFPTLNGGEVEVELDIEMVNAMAPGISQLLVYEENPNVFDPVVILNQIAMDDLAKQIGCSWSLGVAPSGSGTINQILQQMILQGQSFLQASGDSDALLPGQADDPNGFFGIRCNPYVTSVGGTKLTTDVSGNYASEMVWNDRVPNVGQGGYEGSGGGVSDFYTTPSWQQGFGNATNHGSTTGRNFPDVAFTATDIYIIYDNGFAGSVEGTSCAAPLWAGFMALVNQQGVLTGKPPVGFINPTIYALAKTASYNNLFNDITNGDNTWPGSPTNFFAVTGYDLSTGLGTPNTNLINALINGSVAIPVISAPKGPYGVTLSVMTNSDPNGPWFLFVQDDTPGDAGNIANGWLLNLTTADPVGSFADVGISVTPSASSIAISNNVTFVVAVTNYGPSSAENVILSNTLPSGVNLISTVASPNSFTINGSLLTWNLGNLATNAGGQLTIVVNGTSAGFITNSAVVSTTTSDANPDDDAASAIVTVNTAQPAVLSGGSIVNGVFQLTVAGTPGFSYIVQATTNLAPADWVNVYTSPPPYGSPFIFTNLDSTNFAARFYRVISGP